MIINVSNVLDIGTGVWYVTCISGSQLTLQLIDEKNRKMVSCKRQNRFPQTLGRGSGLEIRVISNWISIFCDACLRTSSSQIVRTALRLGIPLVVVNTGPVVSGCGRILWLLGGVADFG